MKRWTQVIERTSRVPQHTATYVCYQLEAISIYTADGKKKAWWCHAPITGSCHTVDAL
jgi:hypothetical protein